MGMRRAKKHRTELPGQVGIVLIPALALEQPGILETRHRLADSEFDHDETPGWAISKVVVSSKPGWRTEDVFAQLLVCRRLEPRYRRRQSRVAHDTRRADRALPKRRWW